MSLEEAIKNIELAIRAYRGTFEEHVVLQNSLHLIKKKLGLEDSPKS